MEKIEQVLGKCDLVEQIWLYGNSLKNNLVAVVVPRKGPLMEWAGGAGGMEGKSYEEVCKSSEAWKHVVKELVATGKGGWGLGQGGVLGWVENRRG